MSDALLQLSAREAVAGLRAGKLDPLELVEAALARIQAIDGKLNAVPTVVPERARAAARRLRTARAEAVADPAWLGGLPVVIKDTHPVEGVRTTFGSTLFAEHVATRTARHVALLEARGAIVLGKSNTPEFAAGGQTFNDVFGPTRNPWDRALTCGGSSGGSAVAVATRMAWAADGSDFGGSLRIPAAFCGVVGLRPSPGRVAQDPRAMPFQTLDVIGPIARDVRDAALLLDALTGPEPADPLSLPAPALPFAHAALQPSGVDRIAFTPDLGGIIPIDPAIVAVLERAVADAGVALELASLPFALALEAFAPLRAVQFAAELGAIAEAAPGRLKPELEANILAAGALDGEQIVTAERARGRFSAAVWALLARCPILALPATILPPFDIRLRYPIEAGGRRFASYFEWAAPTLALSLTGCPALSLPCGLTTEGLPVGLQLVAAPRDEARLLAFAHELEQRLGPTLRPPLTGPIRRSAPT
jgi:amidase